MDRRQFLSLTGGALFTPATAPPELRLGEAERTLQQLATAITKTDLRQPTTPQDLLTTLNDQLPTTRTIAEATPLTRLEQLNEVISTITQLTGVPPTPAKSALTSLLDRHTAIKTAIKYYATIQDTLTSATQLTDPLAEADATLLADNATIPDPGLTKQETNQHREQFTTLTTTRKTILDSPTPALTRLLPPPDATTQALTQFQDAFLTHAAAQRAFIRASQHINQGIQAWEQSNPKDARLPFKSATEAIQIDIPDTLTDHQTSSQSPRLSHYQQAISNYQTALTHFTQSTHGTPRDDTARSAMDTAIRQTINARAQLATQN